MSRFVCHFQPPQMHGATLVPLNLLKSMHLETYEQEAKRYTGREKLMKRVIPILDCLWNDVIHLSPIHPQRVLDVWKQEGMISSQKKDAVFPTFKIPVEKLIESQTVCFQSFNFVRGSYDSLLDKYWRFSSTEYREQVEVHDDQVRVWRANRDAKQMRFWYSHTMHILARQEIDVSDCEIVVCR